MKPLLGRGSDVVKGWMARVLVAALCGVVIAPHALGRAYALYHDSTEDRGTAIVLTNLNDDEVLAQLSAFDANGDLVARADVALAGFASEAVFLEIDPEAGDTWGLVRVETDGRIALAAWFGVRAQWWAVENVVGHLPTVGEFDYTGCWLTTNYANTANRTTFLLLVNPHDEPVEGEIHLYNEFGDRVSERSFELNARTTAFVVLGQDLVVDDSTWGMVDVHSDAPIVLVTEYVAGDGSLIDLDLVSSIYLVDP